jgi:hypothetical protein
MNAPVCGMLTSVGSHPSPSSGAFSPAVFGYQFSVFSFQFVARASLREAPTKSRKLKTDNRQKPR